MAEASQIRSFPNPSGSGPYDLDLYERVVRLEEKVDRIDSATSKADERLRLIELSLAEMNGKLSQIPTALQLFLAIVATWSAGAAIVAGLIRLLGP